MKNNYLDKFINTIITIVFAVALMCACGGCNPAKKAAKKEAKALKPYNEVLTDIDTSYKKKKDNLLDAIVDSKRPNKAKVKVVEKFVQGKPIKVTDTAAILKIANYYESKYSGLKCFTGLQLDSIIKGVIAQLEPVEVYRVDTVYQHREETIIDPTEINRLKNDLLIENESKNACNEDLNAMTFLYNREIEERRIDSLNYATLMANQTKFSYLISQTSKVFIKDYWWLILALIGLLGLSWFLKIKKIF